MELKQDSGAHRISPVVHITHSCSNYQFLPNVVQQVLIYLPCGPSINPPAVSVSLLGIFGVPIFPQKPPECPLHLLVPQGVNERVERRRSHGIEEAKELAPLLSVGIFGLQVDSND